MKDVEAIGNEIVHDPDKIVQYLEDVQHFADQNKAALGFLPKSAFAEMAAKGRLWVATHREECVGYLLFGGRYPALKVFQVFVVKSMRRSTVATRLLDGLAEYGEEHGYLTISARVAADLAANRFWENAGYQLIRQEPGGKTKGRTINIRVKDLNTPSLLNMMDLEDSTPSTQLQDISFGDGPLTSSSVFVLDINVFFDLVKNRQHNAEASRLIHAGMDGQIRLRVTPEFVAELERHSGSAPDPLIQFARTIPTLPEVPETVLHTLIPELRSLVFPNSAQAQAKSQQQASDVRHLVYCIHHRATGFITRDTAILAVADRLFHDYALEVLSPVELLPGAGNDSPAAVDVEASAGNVRVCVQMASEEQREQAERFLMNRGLKPDGLSEVWDPGASDLPRRRVTVTAGDETVAVASWSIPSTMVPESHAFFFVDEECEAAERIIDHILEAILRDSAPFLGRTIQLRTTAEQTLTRQTAMQRGFHRLNGSPAGTLRKFAFSGVVTPANWNDFASSFQRHTGLVLPTQMPNLREFTNTGIMIHDDRGNPKHRLSLLDFETFVSPALIMCPERTGLILPIQLGFARELFEEIEPQRHLFPSLEAALHIERAYFRNPNRAGLFAVGTPVVFYISGAGGGSKEAAALSRITYSEVVDVDSIPVSIQRQGVLSPAELRERANTNSKVHVFTFDSFNPFPSRLSFASLRQHGIVSAANLVTVESLPHDKLIWVCDQAYSMDTTQ